MGGCGDGSGVVWWGCQVVVVVVEEGEESG